MLRKNKIFIVAEAGNNHEGKFKIAKRLIKKAKSCGADAIKFQTFIPDLYVSRKDSKRFSQLTKFQLSQQDFKNLAIYAKKLKIIFFSTPFDLKSANFLNRIQNVFKISSGDSNFKPLLKTVANFNKHIFLSTGMTDLKTIKKSKELIFKVWKKNGKNKNKLVIMHCVSSYPTEKKEANLLAIKTIKENFTDCEVGYSDHTSDITSALSSVALGAKVIERHFTLSKTFSNFRDHKISSDPKEMKLLVNKIREIENILGDGVKKVQKSEKKAVRSMRRGAVAARDILKGTKVLKNYIKWIRIKDGLKIEFENKLLNKRVKKNIKQDEIFKEKHFF